MWTRPRQCWQAHTMTVHVGYQSSELRICQPLSVPRHPNPFNDRTLYSLRRTRWCDKEHDIRWIEEYVANLFQPIVVINLTDINRKADPFDQETAKGRPAYLLIWSVILARSRYFFRRLSGSKPISMLLTISVQSHANVRTMMCKNRSV